MTAVLDAPTAVSAVDYSTTTGGARIVLIDNGDDLSDALRDARDWPLIGLDVETASSAELMYDENGKRVKERLDYTLLSLRSVQFGNTETVYVIDCALLPHWLTPAMRRMLEGKQRKIAHNSTFEYRVLALAGVKVANLVCTMQAERILFQGLLMKSPSLAQLVEKYLQREMLKDVRDTFIEERVVQPLRPEQIRYAADDIDCLLVIFEQQLRQLTEEKLLLVAEFEWAVQRAFGEIMNRGIYLDVPMWRVLLEENIRQRDAAHAALFQSFKPAVIKRWEVLLEEREAKRTYLQAQIDDCASDDPCVKALQAELDAIPSWLKVRPNKETGIREPKKTAMWPFDKVLSSPQQLKQAFLQFGLELPDTNERTLLRVRREWLDTEDELKSKGQPTTGIPYQGLDAIQLLMDFRGLEKRVTGYGENWIKAISPVTNRIHPDFDTLKDTARTGCSDPNIQNVPKRGDGKVYRQCFPAPVGKAYVVADYSQVELRVAAELSGDPNMIKAFVSGLDIHLATASLMFHKDPSLVTKDERTCAKCVNFGILFGIGPGKLAEQITNSPGAPPCSMEEARGYLKMYAASYPRLMAWLRSMAESAQTTFETFTVLGHRRRFLRPISPSRNDYSSHAEWKEAADEYRGRLAGIGREGTNTPVQGTAAVIAKWAILDLERKLPAGAGIVAFIHDEILVETTPDLAEEVAGILKTVMEAAGSRFMKKVPCLADVHVGSDWLGED